MPSSNNITNSSIQISVFTPLQDGMYSFHVTSWNESEELAFQIQINAIGMLQNMVNIRTYKSELINSAISLGTNLAELNIPGGYRVIEDNTVFYANSTIVCATNDTSQIIQWFYVSTQTGNETNLTSLANWNNSTGISIIEIETSQQGYYSCEIMTDSGVTAYTIVIFDPTVTIGKSKW